VYSPYNGTRIVHDPFGDVTTRTCTMRSLLMDVNGLRIATSSRVPDRRLTPLRRDDYTGSGKFPGVTGASGPLDHGIHPLRPPGRRDRWAA
jgi:hypothetical protein